MNTKNYIIASNRQFPNCVARNPEELEKLLKKVKPQYIFFPFWSWKVPKSILLRSKCIGFHTGDFRGGSPVQHLIRRKFKIVLLYMFEMTENIDKGKVIGEALIALQGNLQDIIREEISLIKELMESVKTNNK